MDASGRRQRTQTKASAEDHALDLIAKEAEARLAARRQARAEAREIRMRELERQQKEQEENADKAYDMHAEPLLRAGARGGVGRLLSPAALHSSRRSSEDSLEDTKDVRFELKELEEKFRKTMILNAQLDNDKSSLTYQLDTMKDKLEDIQEQQAQLQRLHREKCSALEVAKREGAAMRLEAERGLAALAARDAAAGESGLLLIALPPDDEHPQGRLAYVSKESEKILEDAGEGTLDVRLQKLHSDKQALEEEVKNLRVQQNSEHSRKRLKWKRRDGSGANGPPAAEESDGSDGSEGAEGRDARRLAGEYLYRACRAEQEAAALGATAARLEAQSQRHKAAAERAERAEDHLKAERRRLQREAREALSRVEELETENSHLTKRLDKLKNAKSALLKDL